MGLLNTEIEIVLYNNIKHYESLGYDIPRVKNKRGEYVVPKGTKILVQQKDLPKGSGQLVNVECDNCKKHYKMIYHNYLKSQKFHNGKTYCVHCIQKVFKKNMEYQEHDRRKYYPDYNDFIIKVLKRDNYTCQCCGNNSHNLEVHHLDGYDWCVEKRTDDTNGITLCTNCHKNFHGKYGRGNNTKEQFEDWIGYVITELKKFNGEIISTRRIYCYEDNKIYDSANSFAVENGLASSGAVYKVCDRNNTLYNTSNNKHLFWYDEYINMSTEEILRIVNAPSNKKSKKVICLTTNKIYNSITEGAKKEQAGRTSIDRCCKNIYPYAHTKDGRITKWMYYEDYIKQEEFKNAS